MCLAGAGKHRTEMLSPPTPKAKERGSTHLLEKRLDDHILLANLRKQILAFARFRKRVGEWLFVISSTFGIRAHLAHNNNNHKKGVTDGTARAKGPAGL